MSTAVKVIVTRTFCGSTDLSRVKARGKIHSHRVFFFIERSTQPNKGENRI